MKIAVCDDEKILRNQIIDYIRLYGENYQITEYANGRELLNANECFDIIFLDIEMPGIDGMSVAEKLRSRNVESIIIFLTSHIECIRDAFKVKAFRFLSKPVDLQDLNEAMRGAVSEILNTEKVVINQRGKIYEVNLKDIVYLEAFGDGTYIYDRFNNVYESTVQLKGWDERLCGKDFFKIHKSYMVSLMYVKKIENSNLFLYSTDTILTISRRNITGFKDAYLKFIKNNAHVI